MFKKYVLIITVIFFWLWLVSCEKNQTNTIKKEEIQKQTNQKLDVVNITNLKWEKDFCDKACKNYNEKCMTKIPNVSKQLLNDSYESCLDECYKWSKMKSECISVALTCEEMTDNCGL